MVIACLLLISGILLLMLSYWIWQLYGRSPTSESGLLYALVHDELSNPLQNTLAALANVNVTAQGHATINIADLNAINERINRLVNVTRDLKSLAILEAAGMSTQKTAVDLAGLTQNVIMVMAPIAENRGVEVTYQGMDCNAKILGNSADLDRILQNLIDNGIKYSRPELCKPSVIVSITTGMKNICIQIEDNGQGMSKDRLNTLGIMPQLRSIRTMNTRGSGMGWLLVRSVVTKHKGSINVDSTLGKGTKVTIIFPSHTPSPAYLS